MWDIPTCLLCDQHLLGEHAELHQEVGQIQAGNIATVRGHVEHGQVDIDRIRQRHDQLERAGRARGMAMSSPLPEFGAIDLGGAIDPEASLDDLAGRCENCRDRIQRYRARSNGGLS